MDQKHEEMKKMMTRSFGKIREAMDRLQKRIAGGSLTLDNDGFAESFHDLIDFMLIRTTMEMFMRGVESTMASEELEQAKSLRDLEFGGYTDLEESTDDIVFLDALNRLFGERKDGGADA